MSSNHNHSDNATKFVANDERMHWHDGALWFVDFYTYGVYRVDERSKGFTFASRW